MRRLTFKQRRFVDETIKTNNPTQAVMRTYEVKNRKIAMSIASENLSKPNIRKSIDEHLASVGYNPTQSIKRLVVTAEEGTGKKATASDQIRADELLLKLSGNLVDKRQSTNLNLNVDSMSKDKLMEMKEKYDKLLEKK